MFYVIEEVEELEQFSLNCLVISCNCVYEAAFLGHTERRTAVLPNAAQNIKFTLDFKLLGFRVLD